MSESYDKNNHLNQVEKPEDYNYFTESSTSDPAKDMLLEVLRDMKYVKADIDKLKDRAKGVEEEKRGFYKSLKILVQLIIILLIVFPIITIVGIIYFAVYYMKNATGFLANPLVSRAAFGLLVWAISSTVKLSKFVVTEKDEKK